jgi:pimeloyl-ACP methyl ester carboxylesterase
MFSRFSGLTRARDDRRSPRIWLVPALLGLLALSSSGQQLTINFAGVQSGPSQYAQGSGGPPISTMGATFSGGMILTGETNIIVGGTVYGVAQICVLCSSTMTIDFATGVTNFGVLLINGLPSTVTYNLIDNNGVQQNVTLTSFATQSVFLVDTRITEVKIQSSTADTVPWDFSITNVKFTPAPAALVDPVPGLVVKNGITTDYSLLSSGGTIVRNVASDGVTQVVIRIQANSVGEQLSLILNNDSNVPSTNPSFDGSLSLIGGPPSLSGLTVTAVQTANGPMAFAVYTAPQDFTRSISDEDLAKRGGSISVQSLQNPTFAPTINLQIVRPPIFLIHGLWDSKDGWDNFGGLTEDTRFSTGRANWGGPVVLMNAILPLGPVDVPIGPVPGSSIGVDYSAPMVLKQLNEFVNSFKRTTSTAAVQVDVVAHSMGGLMTKALREVTTFTGPSNYGKGPIHKVITLGTPHLGSPLALQLLSGQNNCVAAKLASAGLWAFNFVAPMGSPPVTGAINDLAGDGQGGSLSVFLKSTKSPTIQLPMALVAGRYNFANEGGLYSPKSSTMASTVAAVCSNDSIPKALAAHDWASIMGTPDGDGIVPLTSELNGQSNPANVINGIVHSSGAVSLGFNGPTELAGEPGSAIANLVIQLLNEFVFGASGFDFKLQ